MNDHSKFVGYITLSILLIVFVAWTKYGFVSEAVFWTLAIASGFFFISWRMITGTWPGNDARR